MYQQRRALEGPPLPPLSPAPHPATAEPEPPSRAWIGWLIVLCIAVGGWLLHRRMEEQARIPVFSPSRTARARIGTLERSLRVTGTTAATGRVTQVTGSTISGRCFCSESDGTLQSDNTVLFSVVAIGRKV